MDCVPKLLAGIRLSNELPSVGTSYDYYSSFPAFRNMMAAQSSKILNLIQRVLDYQGASASVLNSSVQLDANERFESLIGVNDQLLERIGQLLDQHEMAGKQQLQLQPQHQQPKRRSLPAALPGQQHKPQVEFSAKPDNSRSPFVCRLRVKHNALHDNEEDDEDDDDNDKDQQQQAESTNGFAAYRHPYRRELREFRPADAFLRVVESPTPPADPEDTELTLVTTRDSLTELLGRLRRCTELAVDLEAHNYHSFQGITCLMQISTRQEDFIVDTLALWDHVWQLNEIFSDPGIVKVFHGGSGDLMWLQRDFGIFVVNMFDTYAASHQLRMQRHSLAHLLQIYCGVRADKQYQAADWRQRPLPPDMIRYARCDTHYLLYIYDRMKAELAKAGNVELIAGVFEAGRQLCLRRYEKPQLRPDDCQRLLDRSRKSFNSRQLHALRRLYEWRDSVARQQDESVAYVLPDHMLVAISDLLPREHTGVLACCNPTPALVYKHAHELHKIVQEARQLPVAKASINNESVARDAGVVVARRDTAADAAQLDVGDASEEFQHDEAVAAATLLTPSPLLLPKPAVAAFVDCRCRRLAPLRRRILASLRLPVFRVPRRLPGSREEEQQVEKEVEEEEPERRKEDDEQLETEMKVDEEEEEPVLQPKKSRAGKRTRQQLAIPPTAAATGETASASGADNFDYDTAVQQFVGQSSTSTSSKKASSGQASKRRRQVESAAAGRLAKFRRRDNR